MTVASLSGIRQIGLIGPFASTPSGEPPAAPSDGGPAWNAVVDELLRLRRLPDDWDGQGAMPPAAEHVDQAISWVQQMRRFPQAIVPSRVVPGVRGELFLEWQDESLYLVAEIAAPQRVDWLLAIPGEPNRHWVTEGTMPYFVGLVK